MTGTKSFHLTSFLFWEQQCPPIQGIFIKMSLKQWQLAYKLAGRHKIFHTTLVLTNPFLPPPLIPSMSD